MKAKVLISALATVAMLMAGTSTAAAKGIGSRDMGGKMHRTERHFDNRGMARHHIGKKAVFAHRPSMGARFVNRPTIGRFITLDRERLWLADGVLYRVVRIGNTITYIVVGYL